MKPSGSIRLATWILEHVAPGGGTRSIAGDLLEELHAGRSPLWYWRQVVTAMATSCRAASSAYAPPLIFSAGWTMLYPAWRSISREWLPHAVPDKWLALSWPSPALLELGCGLVPALTFIWIGMLVYLAVRRNMIRGLSGLRVISALSASLNVLLVATMVLLHYFKHAQHDLLQVTREDFYTGFHPGHVSIPLALSLFVALCSVLPEGGSLIRRRRVVSPPVAKRSLWKDRWGFDHSTRYTVPS